MQNNLQYYYKVRNQLCPWWPAERISRVGNIALLILGLHLSGAIHLALIVRKWPVRGKEPSLVNRLRRLWDNPRVKVREWYQPTAAELVQALAGRQIRLVIDCTKIGFNYRLLMIGLAYNRRCDRLTKAIAGNGWLRNRSSWWSGERFVQLLSFSTVTC